MQLFITVSKIRTYYLGVI